MERRFSLYLDGLRLLGALLVLFAHWVFPRFTDTEHMWMRHHDLGGGGHWRDGSPKTQTAATRP